MRAEEPGVARAMLSGGEHPALGEVAVQALGTNTAVGLSAGARPKAYWHLDPNEDAALAVVGEHGVLLAVADGHNGLDVAQCAIARLEERAPDLLHRPPAVVQEALTGALLLVEDDVADLLAHRRTPRDLSRAALSVALVRSGRLFVATYADTAATRVRAGRVKVFPAGDAFLGAPRSFPAHATARLRPGDVVVVCSDGVTDFLGEGWAGQVAESVSAHEDAEAVVRDLIRHAFDGGAGDHLAVAVTITT